MLTIAADGCPRHEGGKDRPPSLIDEIVGAQDHWRMVNAPHLVVAPVRAGTVVRDGSLAEFPEQAAA